MRDRILLIDDEANLRMILEATLQRGGFDVQAFESFTAAKLALDTQDFDVVLTDLQMPEASGMEVLAYCRSYSPDLPVILITAFGTVERAVSAMQMGAFDFILKPFQNDELFRVLSKATESRIRRRREPASDLMSALGVGPVPIPLFGASRVAGMLREGVERASRGGGPVLLLGEVGTGKRSVAREIHRRSNRARGTFIQIHAEAIPPVFQASELFGVEKGADPAHFFSKPGALELASGGTLFLEDVDALAPEVQNRLFTVLEDEFFSRVGGVRRFPIDCRIITTSSKDFDELIRESRFHVELYYKLGSEVIHLSPLRERRDDLASDFAPFFIERAARKRGIPVPRCSPATISWLAGRDWSGNLGELERALFQAVNRCNSGVLEPAHFT
ncbi:sigma-54-dependent Fis family transcriptional regulator [bacterium]|jgi:DNA-binding NtrC family response regulator|nr:sigma-54-dependent Fis family transcriptional regulator [bacterium]